MLGSGSTQNIGDSVGQMGDNLKSLDFGAFEPVGISIASGYSRQYCVFALDGKFKCWGQNDFGQLGVGDNQNRGDSPAEMGDALRLNDALFETATPTNQPTTQPSDTTGVPSSSPTEATDAPSFATTMDFDSNAVENTKNTLSVTDVGSKTNDSAQSLHGDILVLAGVIAVCALCVCALFAACYLLWRRRQKGAMTVAAGHAAEEITAPNLDDIENENEQDEDLYSGDTMTTQGADNQLHGDDADELYGGPETAYSTPTTAGVESGDREGAGNEVPKTMGERIAFYNELTCTTTTTGGCGDDV